MPGFAREHDFVDGLGAFFHADREASVPAIPAAVLKNPAFQVLTAQTERLRTMGNAETALLVQLPFWRRLALALRREPSSAIVYDCMDEWDTFENLGEFNRSEEKLLVEECDVLAVTAEKLRVKFAERGLAPVLAPMRPSHSAEPCSQSLAAPKSSVRVLKPFSVRSITHRSPSPHPASV